MRGTTWEVRTSTPRRRSWSSALRERSSAIGRQNPRATFDEQDAGLLRVNLAKLVVQGMARDFSQHACEFNTGRAASDDHKLKGRFALFGVSFFAQALTLGEFEGQQNAAADLESVFNRLQTGRQRLPLLVAKVSVGRSRGDDQKVVIEHLLAA